MYDTRAALCIIRKYVLLLHVLQWKVDKGKPGDALLIVVFYGATILPG